jgi:hypothetical protein
MNISVKASNGTKDLSSAPAGERRDVFSSGFFLKP